MNMFLGATLMSCADSTRKVCRMGTAADYAPRVAKRKWEPPTPELAERLEALRAKHAQLDVILGEVKDEVTALAEGTDGPAVPIAALAELLGVERKTIYRYTGRPMS
jgi:hypothetical protein